MSLNSMSGHKFKPAIIFARRAENIQKWNLSTQNQKAVLRRETSYKEIKIQQVFLILLHCILTRKILFVNSRNS